MPGCSSLRAKVTLGGILVPVAASAFIRCSGTGLALREGRRVLYKNQCIYHYSGCQVATVTSGLYRGHRPVLQKWRVFNSRGKVGLRCCMFHVWSAHLQLVAEERFPRTRHPYPLCPPQGLRSSSSGTHNPNIALTQHLIRQLVVCVCVCLRGELRLL